MLGFVIGLIALARAAVALTPEDACSLPSGLEHEIGLKFPGAKLVTLLDLGDDDKQLFQKDHNKSCPGMAKVDFYGDGQPTWALVLKTKGRDEHTELVLAHQTGGAWKTDVLGTGSASPDAPVVWSEGPGEYRDVYGKKKIRATKPVIVFCKYESWAILYAWEDNKVEKIWIAD